MAEATQTTRTVTVEEKAFTLTLTEAEFNWLRRLVGNQDPTDGDGASKRIWDAIQEPTDASQAVSFRDGDRVTVQAGAVDSDRSSVSFSGEAIVSFGPDSDGDYFVRSTDTGAGSYVLPQYLRRA